MKNCAGYDLRDKGLAWFAKNWAADHWFLDAANGDDSDLGTSDVYPVRTTEELSRRLAVAVPIDHPVTVHIAQGSYGTLAVRVIQSALACPFDVVGEVVYTDIGTVTSYTDRVAATNTAAHLVASGVPDWTAHVGKRVDVLSGAQAGAVAWVAKANPHSLGVDIARVTRFATTVSTTTFAPAAVSVAAGSAVALAALPTVARVDLDVRGPVPNASLDFVANRGGEISNLQIPSLTITGTGRYRANRVLANAAVGTATGNILASPPNWLTRSCGLCSDGAAIIDLLDAQFCLLIRTSGTAPNVVGRSQFVSCLFQTISASPQPLGVFNDCGVFDSSNRAILLSSTTPNTMVVRGCYGRDNASGISLPNSCLIAAPTSNTVTGAAGDIQLSGQAVYIPWTALPWVDGERSGEATLVVPGTGHTDEATSYVDVTVPYVLSTQKMVAGYKTFGGTTGQLRAAYLNATTVRIVSNSAADTSTVTWHILPVGDSAAIRS